MQDSTRTKDALRNWFLNRQLIGLSLCKVLQSTTLSQATYIGPTIPTKLERPSNLRI